MDLFDIARLSGTFPAQRALIGIEPASLDWGERPSAQVAPAVAEAAGLAGMSEEQAIARANGAEIVHLKLHGALANMAAADGKLYCGSVNGVLAVDALTGEEVWDSVIPTPGGNTGVGPEGRSSPSTSRWKSPLTSVRVVSPSFHPR